MLKNFLSSIKRHRIISAIILIAIFGIGYYAYTKSNNNSSETRYVLAAVEKGMLIVSVSGSGQVSVLNQIDVKPKVSGDLTYVGVQKGQEVKAGTILAQINSQDAQKTIRDAQENLDSAKLSLQKLLNPPDQLSLLQAQNTLTQAKESKQKAEDDLVKTYDDSFNTIANAFLDLPGVMAGLHDIIYGSDLAIGVWNADFYASAANFYDEKAIQYKDTLYESYNKARVSYDKNFSDYKSANRFSQTDIIESLAIETYDTTKDIAQAVKDANNLIQFYKDKMTEHGLKPMTLSDTHLASLNSYTGKTNSHIGSLLSIKSSIQSGKQSIINYARTIEEKTQSLANVLAGPDSIDLQSQQMTIRQRENALSDAKQKLADYSVYAPFDGIIAEATVKKGDAVSAGTTIATMITKQKIAEISLNEIDAAKVKDGQKVTLTFDAIENLTISGQVLEIDALGTVTQGVVSYNVKIGFDTQDDRIKPGMSVSAAIVTDVKQNVLSVPNSAIKTTSGVAYVQILDQPTQNSAQSAAAGQSASVSQGITSLIPPRQQQVEIGISNDTTTEIISGLKEGDQIVVRTVSPTTQTTTQTAPSLFGGGGGAGSVRALR